MNGYMYTTDGRNYPADYCTLTVGAYGHCMLEPGHVGPHLDPNMHAFHIITTEDGTFGRRARFADVIPTRAAVARNAEDVAATIARASVIQGELVTPALEAPAAPAADIHPRALELAAMVTPGATRVDLDPATAPTASYRTARATVTAYFQGGPGRGDCIDAVILTVTGGDSHPARNFAALDAITALQARVSGNITAGEYQTIADGDRGTLFIYGTWNN